MAFASAQGRGQQVGWPTIGTRRGGPTGTAAAALIQHDEGIELPAAGRWPLHRTSSVGIGRRAVPQPVVDGWLEVGRSPFGSRFVIVTGGDNRPIRLTARAIAVLDDAEGLSRWPLVGVADDDGTARDIGLDLVYHGVHRNGDAAWARYTGTARSAPSDRRWRRAAGLTLTLDLLFAAPTARAASVPNPHHATRAA